MNLMFLQNYALIFKSNQITNFNDNNAMAWISLKVGQQLFLTIKLFCGYLQCCQSC